MNLETLIEDVDLADASGPICDHWTTPLHHVSVGLLIDLGLAKPIATRIPSCSAHWCRISHTCARRDDFEKKIGTRGGVKANLTPAGRAAFGAPESLAAVLAGGQMARACIAALTEGPRTVFDLHTRLLEICRQELDSTGNIQESAFRRSDLLGNLERMEATGLLSWDRATGQVAAVSG